MRRAALLLIPLLAGCAATRPADRPVVMRISPRFAGGQVALKASPIAVAEVTVRGAAAGTRYVYVETAAPSVVRQAANLFWEEPPGRVVERALVDALALRFAMVGTVERPAGGGAARVIAQVEQFEETGAGGPRPQATVALNVAFLGEPARQGRFCGSAAIADALPTTRARAFEQALATAVSSFAEAAAGSMPFPPACPAEP
jgi:ABC-type uncharacterized transport system auxiliary subunit